MTSECTWLIRRNSCGFVDYCDNTSNIWFILWYAYKESFNPEGGGNTTLRSIRNCVTSHKSRTISNTADRTWNHITVNPTVSLKFPVQLSLVLLTNCQLYSHSNCPQYCFVIIVYCMKTFSFYIWNFYSKLRPTWSVLTDQLGRNYITKPTV